MIRRRIRVIVPRARAANRALDRGLRGVAAAMNALSPPCAQAVAAGLEEARRRATELTVPHAHLKS